ncbi:MAG: glutamine amidotransferase, partial [Pirellulaceae bacterium]|nr:glutamine amidotransferase [Pirellulaceae bacterium]
AGEKTLLGKQRVRADEDGKQVEVEFAFTPQEVGRYRLVLSAEPQPGELVVKNNRLDAYLTVLEGGLRVLYLDGEKRFEQKFVRRALNASPDIELDDRIIDRRTQGSWPIDLGRDLTDGKYDVFLLGDLDAQALGPANLTALAAAVGKGKGLAMIGGRASFGRGHYLGTPLGNVLPIEINPLEGANFTTREAEDEFFLPGPLPMIPTGSHPITRLASDAENAAVWRALPPLAWANKFLRTKANMPGLKVLLESSAGQPLLVSGEFGQGRVAGFAGESTYLWPLHGHEREHKRFWRQLVLWLARRDDLERNDVWIKLDQRRVNPGTKIQITAGARTAAGDPLTDVQFSTRLIHPDGRQEPLRLASDGTHFAGQVTPRAPGDYAIETVASAGGRQIGTARAEFLVFDRDVELSNPAADPDLMASLAAWTKAEGGRAVAAEELPALLQSLVDQPPEYEVRELRWTLAGTALDAWVFFLTLTSVLAVEWWLRKKWGLV